MGSTFWKKVEPKLSRYFQNFLGAQFEIQNRAAVFSTQVFGRFFPKSAEPIT
jgi:hypothetical protein